MEESSSLFDRQAVEQVAIVVRVNRMRNGIAHGHAHNSGGVGDDDPRTRTRLTLLLRRIGLSARLSVYLNVSDPINVK